MNLLMDKLGYIFKQDKLLKTALTHRSKGGDHNERLEFLGDAIVNLVVAEALFERFPTASEGELSRWRSSLVNRETLGDLAKIFELGNYLILGQGELRSGGSARHSILSCAIEAVIGAIYLDSDFVTIKKCLFDWYQPWLDALSSAASHKDPKTILQEYVQKERIALPLYRVEKIEGEIHQQLFTVSCEVLTQKTFGTGTSRRRAEQESALHMLKVMNI